MQLVAFVLPFGRSRQSLLPLLLLFTLPAVVQAQFQFITNNGVITVTKYTGSGGAVTIPSMTNGYPVACIQGYALSNCPFTSVWIPQQRHQHRGRGVRELPLPDQRNPSQIGRAHV